MSFKPANLVRWSPVYPPNVTNPVNLTIPKALYAPQQWAYQAGSDTISQVLSGTYFYLFADQQNALFYGDSGSIINVGDYIYCVCANGTINLAVTAISDQYISVITSGQQYIKVSMTAAQFNGMYAAPVQMLGTPATSSAYVVEEVVYDLTYVSANYAAGGAIQLQYGNSAHGAGAAASASTAAAVINGFSASSLVSAAGQVTAGARTAIAGKGLYLSNDTAAFTTGDGTWNIHIWYSLIQV